jgi:GNAT superfamily N-acetyltransferase
VGLTRALFLKELYVAQACQRRGVGTLLLRAVFETARRHRCSRVEWTTGRDNRGAQAFYATLGLPVYPSKIFYRVEDTGTGLHLPG